MFKWEIKDCLTLFRVSCGQMVSWASHALVVLQFLTCLVILWWQGVKSRCSIRQNGTSVIGFLCFTVFLVLMPWQSDFGCRRWKKNLPGNCRSRKFSLKWLENRNALTPQHKAAFPNSTQFPAFTPLAPNSGNYCRLFHTWDSPSSSSNPTGSAVYIKGPRALYFQWRQSVSGSVSLLLWTEGKKKGVGVWW